MISCELVFFAANLAELNKRLRIGAVSYLNTLPLLLGVKRSGLMDKIELVEDYPSRIASMLINDEIDAGLVPVAIIPLLKEAHIITDYCIATDDEVASVAIFSEVPLEEVTTLLLDYQSRTSVMLAKILLKEYWHLQPELVDAGEDFRDSIKGNVAALVIGDRALEQLKISKYHYDLGTAWKNHTGLPFVFAVWVANKPLAEDFLDAFNRANGYGIAHLEEVIAENPYTHYSLQTYYTKNIQYRLDAKKREGLSLFLEKLKQF